MATAVDCRHFISEIYSMIRDIDHSTLAYFASAIDIAF
jgi:hypothetical protein